MNTAKITLRLRAIAAELAEITAQLEAADHVHPLPHAPTPVPGLEVASELIDIVARESSIPRDLLLGAERSYPIALPRRILYQVLHLQLGMPVTSVGAVVNRQHHTVLLGIRSLSNECHTSVPARMMRDRVLAKTQAHLDALRKSA